MVEADKKDNVCVKRGTIVGIVERELGETKDEVWQHFR